MNTSLASTLTSLEELGHYCRIQDDYIEMMHTMLPKNMTSPDAAVGTNAIPAVIKAAFGMKVNEIDGILGELFEGY